MPTFDQLKAEYANLWKTMVVKPDKASTVDAIAKRLIGHKAKYEVVEDDTGVPWFVIAALHNRESDASFSTYLGNGQPLNRVTTIVPKGRGPWSTWEEGAVDAIEYDGLDKITDWSPERACFEVEKYNGFGPRGHGINSGYLWSFTNHYSRGKYVKDGPDGWSPSTVDQQCGAIPIIKRLMELDSAAFGDEKAVPPDVPSSGGFWAALGALLARLFGGRASTAPASPVTKGAPWVAAVRACTGIKETLGTGNTAAIMAWRGDIVKAFPDMANYAAQYTADSIPWCGFGLGAVMCRVGIRPPFGAGDTDKFMWADSWSRWGTKLEKPIPGCIMTFTRAGGGHVAMLERLDGDTAFIRGFNQSDQVNVTRKSMAQFTAATWPRGWPIVDVEGVITNAVDSGKED